MSLARRLVAEGLGTALLLAVVVGSGIMAQRLSAGNAAIALLGNSVATGAGLIALIHMFGPISGAHFNPMVTIVALIERETEPSSAAAYVAAQFAGAIIGVWAAHLMFAVPVLQISAKLRGGWPQGFADAVATFGLIGTIMATRRQPDVTPIAVGLYITAAYWFTASTSFANPAVTLARSFSDTFAGIAPASVPMFIAGQCAGAIAALGVFGWLLAEERPT